MVAQNGGVLSLLVFAVRMYIYVILPSSIAVAGAVEVAEQGLRGRSAMMVLMRSLHRMLAQGLSLQTRMP